MTTDDRFGRTLADWLEQDTRGRVPGHLDEVLVHTVATRQRPWWSSPRRWLPMDLPATRTNLPRVPVLGIVAAAILVILVFAALVLVAGSQRHVPPPFGPARNGVIGFGINGDLLLADADGSNTRTIVSSPDQDEGISFSHDGTKLVFNRVVSQDKSTVMVADIDGSHARPLVDRPLGMAWWFDWSPSDDRVVIAHQDADGRKRLSIASVDDPSRVQPLDLPGLDGAGYPLWRPPDGSEIVFVGDPVGPDTAALYAIHPDGTRLRQIGPSVGLKDADYGLQLTPDGRTAIYWNVDPDGPRIHELDIDSHQDRVVTFRPDGRDESDPNLSPDGRQVLSQRWLPGNQFRLQVGPIDGSTPAQLIGPPFQQDDGLATGFSPDGSEVVLSRTGQPPLFIDLATGTSRSGPTVFPFAAWQRTGP
jgi:Tol biopolymer transport system component